MTSGTESSTPTWADLMVLVERLDRAPYKDVAIDMAGLSIRMSRTAIATTVTSGVDPSAASPAATIERSQPQADKPGNDGSAGIEIAATMLGVVYGRPAPDQEPFVAVGDTIKPSTTVAVVEVMKMMNHIEAGVSGRVSEILFADGDTVEFGQPLFRVDPGNAP